jgi:hypothetical protein
MLAFGGAFASLSSFTDLFFCAWFVHYVLSALLAALFLMCDLLLGPSPGTSDPAVIRCSTDSAECLNGVLAGVS